MLLETKEMISGNGPIRVLGGGFFFESQGQRVNERVIDVGQGSEVMKTSKP